MFEMLSLLTVYTFILLVNLSLKSFALRTHTDEDNKQTQKGPVCCLLITREQPADTNNTA